MPLEAPVECKDDDDEVEEEHDEAQAEIREAKDGERVRENDECRQKHSEQLVLGDVGQQTGRSYMRESRFVFVLE